MRRMIRIVLPVLLLGTSALFLAGCAASGASAADMQKRQQAIAQSDHLIVPGQRIGPVRLGVSMDEVLAKLGQPDLKYLDNSGHPRWKYWSLNLVLDFDSSPAPAVDDVSTQTWTDEPLHIVFRTAEGIGIGSSSFDVKRAYGSPQTAAGGADAIMRYDSLQITFSTSNYKVDLVAVPQ